MGILFGLTAGLLWGLDGVLLGNAGAGNAIAVVLLTACIHDGLAAVWLLLLNWRMGKLRQYAECLRKQFVSVLLCALLGGAAGMSLNVTAISMAGASAACAVTSAYPAAGALIAMLFLKERCRLSAFLGIICVAGGAAVIGFSPADDSQFGIGLLFAVGAMLCWALEGTFSKSGMQDISPDVLIGVRELLSALTYAIILTVLFFTNGASAELFQGMHFPAIAAASVAGAFSYLCWYRSMHLSGVTVGMALNATYALWAVLLDIPINGVPLSLQTILGAAVILLGTIIVIFTDQNRKEPIAHEETIQQKSAGSWH